MVEASLTQAAVQIEDFTPDCFPLFSRNEAPPLFSETRKLAAWARRLEVGAGDAMMLLAVQKQRTLIID